ncbi:MAG: hypothetical protein J2P48_08530 [Alphaproteobacteria bacterium]|nr:hypothetical protein [Alphaproteobacteria bacterium]
MPISERPSVRPLISARGEKLGFPIASLHHAAGATAIFNESPFESRFRDMYTAYQQSRGRPVHLQPVGQILFGLELQTALFIF